MITGSYLETVFWPNRSCLTFGISDIGSASWCWQNSTTLATTLLCMLGKGISLGSSPLEPAAEEQPKQLQLGSTRRVLS